MKPNPPFRPLHPPVGIGPVHLKVADLERSLTFYRDVLGFEVTQRSGPQAAFLSAGGCSELYETEHLIAEIQAPFSIFGWVPTLHISVERIFFALSQLIASPAWQ